MSSFCGFLQTKQRKSEEDLKMKMANENDSSKSITNLEDVMLTYTRIFSLGYHLNLMGKNP